MLKELEGGAWIKGSGEADRQLTHAEEGQESAWVVGEEHSSSGVSG